MPKLLSPILLLSCVLPLQAQTYFVAAMPTEDVPSKFAASVYLVESKTSLREVRQVISAGDGVHSAFQSPDGSVVLISGNVTPEGVSIVHAGDPSVRDDVKLNIGDRQIIPAWTFINISSTGQAFLVTPLLPNIMDAIATPVAIQLSGIADSNASPRVRLAVPQDYLNPEFTGEYGGPQLPGTLPADISSDGLSIDSGKGIHHYVLAMPRDIVETLGTGRSSILAGNSNYLIICEAYRGEKTALRIGIWNKISRTWSIQPIDGAGSLVRLFGDWLTSDTAYPVETPPTVDRSQERGANDLGLPDVRMWFQSHRGRFYRFPGRLVLRNLKTGDHLEIVTGQEDSEVLGIDGDTAYYRVNDAIYSKDLKKSGDTDSNLVVQNAYVPEIHWMIVKRSGK